MRKRLQFQAPSPKMFILFWGTLLFFVRSNNADSDGEQTRCTSGFCITFVPEITAETGLCVVIPCAFFTPFTFTPKNMVWFKCHSQKCSESYIIFHSKNNNKVQSTFKDRVSLLNPDVDTKNCSIIINDLTESDSGSYYLRVNGFNEYWRTDGFSFSFRTTVTVKDLIQKPTVMVPSLTEGQQATLTCTAPGLCSGSDPKITWTWRGTGENVSHITGNTTDFKTENLTAVTQRHRSTLTFNASTERHGTSVTCKVSFTNGITTEETVILNVTYVKGVKITGNTTVMEGETLNLTCSVESFPPSVITWTRILDKNTQINQQNNTLTDLQNDTLNHVREESGIGTFSISNMAVEDSGQLICTAKHLNSTLMEIVDVKVIYMKKPIITGNTNIAEGDVLNLTCRVESFPLSCIAWTKLNTNLNNEPDTDLQCNNGSATILISTVKEEHSGQYVCSVQHLDTTVTIFVDVTVTLFPKVLKTSGCKIQSEVLTCLCVSEGSPLPTIRWPLLKNYAEYSVFTSISKDTINSTFTLSVKDHNNTTVECVSSNEIGETKSNLTCNTDTSSEQDQRRQSLNVSWLEVIIAFLIGVLSSAVVCCLATKCHRTKQKNFGNLNETLEMVTSQEDPLMDAGPAVENEQIYYQEGAEGGEGSAAPEKAAPDLDSGSKDVEYASIDFSALKRRTLREAEKKQEATETEYAEIKKKVKDGRQENERGDEGEISEGKEEVIEENEKTERAPEEEGEDAKLYSNVKDVLSEI